MDMYHWLEGLLTSEIKKPMPILSFPGVQLTGVSVGELVQNGSLQAQCIKAISDRYDMLAVTMYMDLSVEAEAFGSPVRFSDDEVPTITSSILNDDEDVENLKIPEVGAARAGEYIKGVTETKKLIVGKPVFAGSIGSFSLAGRLFGMTEIMIKSMLEPDIVNKALEKITVFLIQYIKAFKDTGADGIIIAEPAAGLLSPELNAQFSIPYIERIIDSVQDKNFIVVYHNCGNTIPLLDDIIRTGAKAIHLGNSIDITEALKRVPKDLIVMGNIDPAGDFRYGTPESISKVTSDLLLTCSKFSNYILSSGCDIPPQSPIPNIDAFFSAADAFARGRI